MLNFVCVGAVKMKLKWADGKVLKEIIDQQVSQLVHTFTTFFHACVQMSLVLGPKTSEDDNLKAPKVHIIICMQVSLFSIAF